MTVRVLGPLDTGTAPLSPRERTILAALIVRLGSAVTPAELAEACWGTAPPATWGQQVKTSIARIRQRLGKDAVATIGSEYAVGIEPDVIDAVRFERLVSTARQHSLHEEHDRAIDAYQRALGLWRGTAYPELADWEPGVVEAMRLDEIRHSAEEELLEARLRAGEHRAVVPAAERLVREAPLREDRWAILALANYQSGRQAEALAVMRAARDRVRDELGIEPGTRLSHLETAMLRHDPALDPVMPLARIAAECPYRGLSAFGPDDADEFFGRETEIDELLPRIVGASVTAVAGPSGSGKSSLVLAGLVPRLRDRGRRVEVLRPGCAGSNELRRITADGLADVIVIDQAEELLHAGGDDIAPFCARAELFVERGGALVLTVRSDFLDQAVALPHLGAAVARGVFLVGPLSREAMRDAVIEPARRCGIRLEPGLVELVLRDAAGRPSTLPPLSHAMQETWVRREGVTMTVDGYEAAGGIGGAIAQSAEELYRRLDPGDRALCRALILRLVERADDGLPLRRRVALDPLTDDADRRRVIDALIASRLVAVDGTTIELVHESVATAWPRLAAWLTENAADSTVMQSVAGSAEGWDAGGRRPEDLLRGARLEAALDWRGRAAPDLTAAEQDLLDESEARRRAEEEAVTAQAAKDRRQNRSLRAALAGAAALLVASVVATGFAVVRGNDAAAAAKESLIQAVTSTSGSLLSTNREIAGLLAVEAYRRWPDDSRTASALMGVMTAAGSLVGNAYIPDTEWRIGAWPIPGSDQAAVVRDYTHLEIHDARTGALVRSLAELPDTQHLFRPWVRVSADGSTIAVVQHTPEPSGGSGEGDVDDFRDEVVSFFDVESGEQVGSAIRVDDLAATADLSADGSLLTWATMGRVLVVDRDTGAVRVGASILDGVQPQPGDGSGAGAFLPDGTIVATSMTGRAVVVDPVTLEVVRELTIPAGSGGAALAVGADGVTTTYGGTAMATLDPEGELQWTRPVTPGECSRVAVSSVRRLVLCGDESGTVQRWNLDTGDPVGQSWDYQLGATGDLALSDDESELLLMSALSPSIARLRIDGTGPAASSLGDAGLTVSWGFDPSGRYVVLGEKDTLDAEDLQPRYEIWDTLTDELVLRVPEDLPVDDDALVTDPRWLGDDKMLVWLPDVRTNDLHTAIVDIHTRELVATDLPLNTWWVFTDPGADVAFVALADIPETETVESTELLAYDLPTWNRLSFTIDVDGEIGFVSSTPDLKRIAVTEWLPGEPAYRTTVYDERGVALASGLPRSQASVMLADGSLAAATATAVEQYDATTLTRTAVLPGPGAFVWSLTASTEGHLLAHGGARSGVALIDAETGRRIGGTIPGADSANSAINLEGSGFVTSGPTGVQYWTLDPDDHARATCALVGREPTPEEWRTYFADLGAQHPICDGF